MSPLRTMICLNCDGEINLPQDSFDNEKMCRCPDCHHEFKVNYDAECVDGEWSDLTTLIPTQDLDKIG